MTKANRPQSNKISFEGQEIFIGIDTHLKQWNVSVICENVKFKSFQQPPSATALKSYLDNKFPGGSYHAAYECGICGFQPYYKLAKAGIDGITFNPADIGKTDKQRRRKCDSVDAATIATELKAGRLEALYVPSQKALSARTLMRARFLLDKKQRACKNQIKNFLYVNGIEYPEIFANEKSHWTRRFIGWLRSEASQLPAETSGYVLNQMLDLVEYLHLKLLAIGRKITALMKTPEYAEQYRLLRTLPGVGMITATTLLLEIIDFKRFPNATKLAAFIGLIPDTNSSADLDVSTGITKRKNKFLRYLLRE